MKHFSLFTILSILVAASGCGGGTNFGPMGSVSGKLSMDGKPLTEGTQLLFMQMSDGYAAFAHTDAEGSYQLQWMREGVTHSEVPVGDYKILIQPPTVRDVEELTPEEMLEGADADLESAEPDFPSKYQEHRTSGLTFTVKEGANTCDLDLKSM